MEIGGYDLFIETSLPVEKQLEFAAMYLQRYWPQGVTEKDMPGTFFFYKNPASKISWDLDYTEENCHDMIYVLCGDGCITFVHEGLDEEDVKNAFSCWNTTGYLP